MQYLINEDGQYVGVVQGTASEIIEQTPPGHITTILVPPRSTDYWDGTNWTPIGVPPAYYYKFDYKTKAWVDTRDIESVKTSKWNQIKLERNKAEFSGFAYEGMHFDSDQVAQGRILAAYMFNQPVSWTLSDDSLVLLSVEDIQGVAATMAAHIINVHNQARLSRIAINDALSIEEVESVLFDGR